MIKITKSTIICIFLFAILACDCEAGARDHKTDLVMISSHVVSAYVQAHHKAGDADGEFIEDVVIPAVGRIVRDETVHSSPDYYQSLLTFFVVSQPMASEEIGAISSYAYRSHKREFCDALNKISQAQRALVLTQVQSGLASTGEPVPPKICS